MADLEADRKLLSALEECEEWQKCRRGEPFLAFGPEILGARTRCFDACERFNNATDRSRWNMVKLWKEITLDFTPLPLSLPPANTDTTTTTTPTPPGPPSHAQPPVLPPPSSSSPPDPFATYPTVIPPVHIDYGLNVHLGPGVFVNFNATFIDPLPITIGARTLVGPNCNFFAGSHPLDPAVRNGCDGPELASPIAIGEDCWFGGNVIVLPGVCIGRGCTIGAGSVVTKDVPPFHVVAGNPARIIRKIESILETQPPSQPLSQPPNSTAESSTLQTQ